MGQRALQALVLPLSRLPHVDLDACASRIAAVDVSAIAAIPSALPAGAADCALSQYWHIR